jgi:hypothetical protein
MASSGKKKTTMAKLMRESRLRERRLDKQARKDARKSAAAAAPVEPETWTDGAEENGENEQTAEPDAEQPPARADVTPALADA